MSISTPVSASHRLSLTMLFGAAALCGALWAIGARQKRRGASRTAAQTQQTNQHRDQTLKDTFPASDAPATRDFAIPINAR